MGRSGRIEAMEGGMGITNRWITNTQRMEMEMEMNDKWYSYKL